MCRNAFSSHGRIRVEAERAEHRVGLLAEQRRADSGGSHHGRAGTLLSIRTLKSSDGRDGERSAKPPAPDLAFRSDGSLSLYVASLFRAPPVVTCAAPSAALPFNVSVIV